jgi:hypothetical protein
MVRIRFGGNIIAGEIVKQVEGSTDWLVQAAEHGARFVKGTILRVQPKEFVDGPPPVASPAAPQPAAVADALASPISPVSAEVSAEILPPAPPPATVTEDSPMSALADKLKLAAAAGADLAADLGKQADDIINEKAALQMRGEEVFAKHRQVLADANAGLTAVEDALNQITNGAPAAGH